MQHKLSRGRALHYWLSLAYQRDNPLKVPLNYQRFYRRLWKNCTNAHKRRRDALLFISMYPSIELMVKKVKQNYYIIATYSCNYILTTPFAPQVCRPWILTRRQGNKEREKNFPLSSPAPSILRDCAKDIMHLDLWIRGRASVLQFKLKIVLQFTI